MILTNDDRLAVVLALRAKAKVLGELAKQRFGKKSYREEQANRAADLTRLADAFSQFTQVELTGGSDAV